MNKTRLEAFSDGVIAIIITTTMNLLFWLSLVPFTTGWMGENHFAATPMVAIACMWLLPDRRIEKGLASE